jgi:hypothetical protein
VLDPEWPIREAEVNSEHQPFRDKSLRVDGAAAAA